MSQLLAVRNIRHEYADHRVLENVTFSANGGEFVALLGLNGAGKSTLLDIVAGIRKPHSGEVLLEGNEISATSSRQRAHLVSHLPQGTKQELPFTVEQVVLMGRYPHMDSWFESSEDKAWANEAMWRMDCVQFRHRRYSTLSGGEQQRVLLASCIAQRPRVMLFDEPSTYLDVDQQLRCFASLLELALQGILCVAVTHDINLALTYCSRILLLHQGRITADFAAEEAGRTPDWLSLLSPQLRMAQTPGGEPWVRYR